MRVLPTQSEPTRFFIESESLECTGCRKLYDRRKWLSYVVGTPCPSCEAHAQLDLRFHMVDTARFFPIGECQCEAWQMNKKFGPTVRRMKPEQREALAWDDQEALRCKHIKAARSFSLNLSIQQHEAARLVNAPARRVA